MHAQHFSAASKSGHAKSKQSATHEMTVTAEGPRRDLKKQGVLCVHVHVHVHVKCLCVHCKSIGMYSVCKLSGVRLHKVLHMYM